MFDRVRVIVLRFEPGGGVALQLRDPFRKRALCLEDEQVAKEMVIAEPLAGAVQADDELVLVGGCAEPLPPVRRTGDRVDERPRESIEDRRLQETLPVVGRCGGEQLVAEVADDELIVAPERLDELRWICGPFE